MQFLWDSESCQFTLEKILFACVVTWELLGNICYEELEGHIISRGADRACNICSEELERHNFKGCRQSVQYAGMQSFHWLERLKLHGCCGRFHHN